MRMIALFVFTLLVTVTGIALIVQMYRRDQPTIGATGLGALMFAAILAVVYGTLDTA
jgi:hypothetical protein